MALGDEITGIPLPRITFQAPDPAKPGELEVLKDSRGGRDGWLHPDGRIHSYPPNDPFDVFTKDGQARLATALVEASAAAAFEPSASGATSYSAAQRSAAAERLAAALVNPVALGAEIQNSGSYAVEWTHSVSPQIRAAARAVEAGQDQLLDPPALKASEDASVEFVPRVNGRRGDVSIRIVDALGAGLWVDPDTRGLTPCPPSKAFNINSLSGQRHAAATLVSVVAANEFPDGLTRMASNAATWSIQDDLIREVAVSVNLGVNLVSQPLHEVSRAISFAPSTEVDLTR